MFHSQRCTPAVISVNSFVRASGGPTLLSPANATKTSARATGTDERAQVKIHMASPLAPLPGTGLEDMKQQFKKKPKSALLFCTPARFGARLVTLKHAASFCFSSAASFCLFASDFNPSLASLAEGPPRERCTLRQEKGLDGYYVHQEPLVNTRDKHPATLTTRPVFPLLPERPLRSGSGTISDTRTQRLSHSLLF